MKNAVKFGFGFALGTWLFAMVKGLVDGVTEKWFQEKFNTDALFRERVRVIAPELYVKYRKEKKD